MKKINLLNIIIPLFFFPIYFTLQGIYKVGVYSRGLVLPLTFFLGIIVFCIMFVNSMLKKNVVIKTKTLIYVIILYYLMLCHTLVGYLFYYQGTSVILYFQQLTGLLGIFIAVWIIKSRKMKLEDIYFKLSIVFTLAILSNIASSINKVGIIQTFSRQIYPSTHLGGIHQIHIYYPFIVSMVFLFALPIWEKHKYLFLPVYSLVTIYIVMLQVRGAILSYLTGLISYFMIFTKRNKFVKLVTLTLIFTFLFIFLPRDVIIGRFDTRGSGTSFISGREKVWEVYLKNLKNDPLYIIRGSYLKSNMANKLSEDPLRQGVGHSYHNQYIEIIDSYGIIIFLAFMAIILKFLFICRKQVLRLNKDKRQIYNYWLFLVLLHFIIDLNVNVPLRVTNPAIMYFFYWTSFYLGLHNVIK